MGDSCKGLIVDGSGRNGGFNTDEGQTNIPRELNVNEILFGTEIYER